MLQGRQLAHLYERELSSFNRAEWYTFLVARADNVEGGGAPRPTRWRMTLIYLFTGRGRTE